MVTLNVDLPQAARILSVDPAVHLPKQDGGPTLGVDFYFPPDNVLIKSILIKRLMHAVKIGLKNNEE